MRRGRKVAVATRDENQRRAATDPETWVDQHGDILFRFAVRRVRDSKLAEEIVQETFLAAFGSRDRFAGRSTERTWLVQILRNKIVDHYRRRNREIPASDLGAEDEVVDQLFNEKGAWRNKPGNWTPDPGSLIEQEEFLQVLQGCLGGLPERQAQAFILRVMDEMQSNEVCKSLDVTATNLGVLLHRARLRLRSCLESNWFGREG